MNPLSFFSGVMIHANVHTTAADAIKALVAQLKENNVDALHGATLDVDKDTLLILVGPKPMPRLVTEYPMPDLLGAISHHRKRNCNTSNSHPEGGHLYKLPKESRRDRRAQRLGSATLVEVERVVGGMSMSKQVAAKTALNAKNLEALGAERLAELLIEISTGNAAAKRRLKLELAGAQSPAELAKEVRRRLATIARSRSFVERQGIRSLADDLEAQRRAVVETVARKDPREALDLLWRFMGLAPSILDRCDDSNGTVISVFHDACSAIGDVALAAKPDATALADQAFEALVANDYGQFDGQIGVLTTALGQTGLEHLRQPMIDLSNRPVAKPADKVRVKIGWSSAGPIYAEEMAERSRISTVRHALQDIADAMGDADAFIEQFDEQARKVPKIAATMTRLQQWPKQEALLQ
jgi:Family of unknown function (DUF6880)